MNYIRRILPYLRPYWWLAALSILMTVFAAGAGLLAPWPLTILIDNVLGSSPLPPILDMSLGALAQDRTSLLIFAVIAGVVVTLLSNLLSVVSEYVNTRLEQRIILDFRGDLFRHAERLSVPYTERVSSMRLMYGINFEAAAAGGLIMALQPLAQSALTLIGMVWISFQIDPLLALLSMSVVPFLYYSVGYYSTHIQSRLMNVKGMEAESLAIVHEAMQTLRVVVAFARENFEHNRFITQGGRTVDARVKLTLRQTLFSLAVNMTTALGTALVLGVGAYHALEGKLTAGQLLVVLSYIGAVYKPLEAISYTIGSLQDKFVGLAMAFHVMDTAPEVSNAAHARALDHARGDLRFENVSFDYPERSDTLKDISFEVKAGQVVALVGPTGAGKTTLMSLIPRFYDPAAGRILLDGIDLRELSLESLRAQISIVPQEPLLFSGSIADNIRYGRLDATMDEIVQAAQAANAHDFILRLPKQYDTRVGERGVQLSGGERQRICVARAFVKNAPILILDEPTSSIDSRTEAVILDALDRLMTGRTTFMIAHRLSTVRHSDLILVLNQGELVEQGTHEQLLEQNGLYAQLHSLQLGQARKLRKLAASDDSPVNPLPVVEPSNSPELSMNEIPPSLDGRGPGVRDLSPSPVGRGSGDTSSRPNQDQGKAIALRDDTSGGRSPKIVLLGMMSRHPEPGVVWQTLHYLVGFRRLGFDPYYVEAHGVTPNRLINRPEDDSSLNAARFIASIMEQFDLADKWAFHALHADGRCYGMSQAELESLYQSAELIINLHGGTMPLPEHSATGRLIYLETDPVALQIELYHNVQSTVDFLSPHVAFFTFGENYGKPGCALPVDPRFAFKPTRQPVIVDWWQSNGIAPSDRFTTIGNWRQQGRDVQFNGETLHWSKHYEFMKFLELPQLTPQPFELALGGYTADDQKLLEQHGWRVRPARPLSADLHTYRNYILPSRGEFTVAKEQNVLLKSGWFSDRSATYLAAGRPVITQETGFSQVLPTGEGLFGFLMMSEILDAVEAINADYVRHSKAAAQIAREFFNYDVVLTRLLDDMGISVREPNPSLTARTPAQPAAPGQPLAPEDCRVHIEAALPDTLEADESIELDCVVENLGKADLVSAPPNPIHISYQWLDYHTGLRVAGSEGVRTGLDEPLPPHTPRSYTVRVTAPPTAGQYILHLTLVQENVAWFDDLDASNACVGEVRIVQANQFTDQGTANLTDVEFGIKDSVETQGVTNEQ